ncbi:MAG: hypothetical protein Kow0059_00610 [Candidatus Sumerlaeia bacterium]
MKPRQTFAFTLIELLIVVAIIAILAAIAVPNFLEAQVRSKVSRVRADFRSLATAMEAYAVDYNHYPPNKAGPPGQFALADVYQLTTPISYISNVSIVDPFAPQFLIAGQYLKSFQYYNFEPSPVSGPWISWAVAVLGAGNATPDGSLPRRSACVVSWGPNVGKDLPGGGIKGDEGGEWYCAFGPDLPPSPPGGSVRGIDRIYDPTNGTVSIGDLVRVVGATGGWNPTP